MSDKRRQEDEVFRWYLENQAFTVDAHGRVWRVKTTSGSNRFSDLIFRPCMPFLADTHFSSNGYRRVSMSRQNMRFTRPAHVVVMAILHGEPPGDEFVVHHKDSDRQNNRLHNLALVTRERNQQYIDWTEALNEDNAHMAGFTAFFMREAINSGQDVVDVARRFGVAPTVAAAVAAGHIYPDEAHV